MSLTITSGSTQITKTKTGENIDSSLYGFVAFSSHLPGMMEAKLLTYNSKEDCDNRKLPVLTNLMGSNPRIVFEIPEGEEPGLSLAQSKIMEKLSERGFSASINSSNPKGK